MIDTQTNFPWQFFFPVLCAFSMHIFLFKYRSYRSRFNRKSSRDSCLSSFWQVFSLTHHPPPHDLSSGFLPKKSLPKCFHFKCKLFSTRVAIYNNSVTSVVMKYTNKLLFPQSNPSGFDLTFFFFILHNKTVRLSSSRHSSPDFGGIGIFFFMQCYCQLLAGTHNPGNQRT